MLKLFLDCHGLHQAVRDPTYNVLTDQPLLLDLVLIKQPHAVVSTFVSAPFTDHCPVSVQLSLKKNHPPKPYTCERFIYDDADVDSLRCALASSDWSTVAPPSVTVHGAATYWTDFFLSTCRKFVPQRTVRVSPMSKPWFSRHLRYIFGELS